MDTSGEKLFYGSLGTVPEVPECVLENIERNTGHSSSVRRGLLAACLAMAFIVPALVLTKIAPSAAYADNYESMNELFYAFQYLNGDTDDLTDDYLLDGNTYSLISSGKEFSNED